MRTSDFDARRIVCLLAFATLFFGLTAHPAGAFEGCAGEDDRLRLTLLDPSPGDGTVTVVELQSRVAGITSPAEQARVQAILE